MTKLNYRHNMNTIRKCLAKVNETAHHTSENGHDVYTLFESNEYGKLTKTCGVFYKKSDLIEYVNKILKSLEIKQNGY